MEASDELLTIAELAIGLAGFSGVVAAFTHQDELNDHDRYQFIVLFSVALTAVFVAFVPFGFHHAGFTSGALWAWSSGTMLVTSIVTTVLLAIQVPPVAGHPPLEPQFDIALLIGEICINPA